MSDTDGIEDALKVLAEIEGPTEPLRKMLEELRDKTLGKEDRADLANAIPLALLDLEKYFDEGDDDLRGSAGI